MCPQCKVIINGGFVGNAAKLYSEFSQSGSARVLALTAAAAYDTFKYAIGIGVLESPSVDDWKGCDEASEILSWVNEGIGAPDKTVAIERNAKMDAWTGQFAATALDVVSGKKLVHTHGHDHDGDEDDLLGK